MKIWSKDNFISDEFWYVLCILLILFLVLGGVIKSAFAYTYQYVNISATNTLTFVSPATSSGSNFWCDSGDDFPATSSDGIYSHSGGGFTEIPLTDDMIWGTTAWCAWDNSPYNINSYTKFTRDNASSTWSDNSGFCEAWTYQWGCENGHSNGIDCVWTGTNCIVANDTNCENYNSYTLCENHNGSCRWSFVENKCVASYNHNICGDLDQCKYCDTLTECESTASSTCFWNLNMWNRLGSVWDAVDATDTEAGAWTLLPPEYCDIKKEWKEYATDSLQANLGMFREIFGDRIPFAYFYGLYDTFQNLGQYGTSTEFATETLVLNFPSTIATKKSGATSSVTSSWKLSMIDMDRIYDIMPKSGWDTIKNLLGIGIIVGFCFAINKRLDSIIQMHV